MIYNDRLINETLTLIKPSLKLLKISDEEYFGDKYKNYISNSSMKKINPLQDGDPYSYKFESDDFTSGFLDIGSIIHLDILENIKAKLIIGDVPTTAKMINLLNEASEIQLKDGSTLVSNSESLALKHGYKNVKVFEKNVLKFRRYYQYLLNKEQNTFFISESSKEILDKCQTSIEAVKTYLNSIVGEHYYEEAILGEFQYSNDWINPSNPSLGNSILKVKAKLDNFIIDHDNKTIILNDLKTTMSDVDEFMETSFDKFHYSRQFSFYLYLLDNLINKHDYKLQANVIVISKKNGNHIIYPIQQDHIEEGYYEFDSCLKRIGFHEKYGYNVLIDSI